MTKQEYLSAVPPWCRMHPMEHLDGIGGCWSISYGFLQKWVRDACFCVGCDFSVLSKRMVRAVQQGVTMIREREGPNK